MCCEATKIMPPKHEFRCTMQMARAKWSLPSATLPVVCKHLRIPLDHHNALSDAEAEPVNDFETPTVSIY